MDRNSMSKSDSSRIQSSQAKAGRDMSSGGFAARAQSAADRHGAASGGQATGNGSGGQSGAGANKK